MSVTGAVEMIPEPPGRHHTSVQTGSGLRRSHCRNAKSLASMMSWARAYPLEPSPTARQTHAEASDEASVNNEAATTNAARVRPIRFSPEALDPVLRARVFLSVSFGELRAAGAREARAAPLPMVRRKWMWRGFTMSAKQRSRGQVQCTGGSAQRG